MGTLLVGGCTETDQTSASDPTITRSAETPSGVGAVTLGRTSAKFQTRLRPSRLHLMLIAYAERLTLLC
jgi:hypothetical protein